MQIIFFFQFTALISALVPTLDPSKSFLINNISSVIHSFAFDGTFLYIPSSNDIVQRSFNTSLVVRTLRGHSSNVLDMCLLNNTLFSCSDDGLIIQWDLKSGSVIKRIDAKCKSFQIQLFYDSILVGCRGSSSLMLSIATGQILHLFDDDVSQAFYVCGDEFYTFNNNGINGLFLYQRNFSKILVINDTVTAVVRDSDLLFFALDTFIIMKKSLITGQITQFLGTGHINVINGLYVIDLVNLISCGDDQRLIRWDINLMVQVTDLACVSGIVHQIIKFHNHMFLSGDSLGAIIVCNYTANNILKTITGTRVALTSLAIYEDSVIAGGDMVQLKEWSISIRNLQPSFPNNTYSSSNLFITAQLLLYCLDRVYVRDLVTKFVVKEFALNEVACLSSFYYAANFVYAPSINLAVNKYNLTSSLLVLIYNDKSVVSSCTEIFSSGPFLLTMYMQQNLYQWDINGGHLMFSYVLHYPLVRFVYIETGLLMGSDVYLMSFDPIIYTVTLVKVTSCQIYAMYVDISRNTVFIGGNPPVIYGLDINKYEVVYNYMGHVGTVASVVGHGDYIFSSSDDGSVKQWSLLTKRLVFSFEDKSLTVSALVSVENDIIYGSLSGILYDFDIRTAYIKSSHMVHKDSITDMVLSTSKEVLFTSSLDQTIAVFNTSLLRKSWTFNVDSIPNVLYWYEDFLYSGNMDYSIVKWNSTQGIKIKTYLGHNTVLNDVVVDSQGLFSAGSDSIICLWDINTGIILMRYKAHSDQVTSIFVYESNLFSASLDKTIIMWDITLGSIIKLFQRTAYVQGHLGPVNQIKICNGYLFSASSDLTTRQWDIAKGTVVDILFGHSKAVRCLFCMDSNLFSGSDDGSVLLWYPVFDSIKSLTQVQSTEGIVNPVLAGNLSVNYSSYVIYLLLGIAVLLILVVFTGTMYCLRKKDKTETKPEVSILSAKNQTEMTTMFTQTLGLAIPGFLEVNESSFKMLHEFGKGGAGTIFMCEINGKKENFVAKKICDNYEDLNLRKKLSFDQEVTVMEYIKNHRNVAKIVGFCRQPCCILMKFYERGSLDSFIHSSSSYSKETCVKFLFDIARGLNFMHNKRLAHCDLKPQNVLIDFDDGGIFLVLTDFGISVILDEKIIDAQMFNAVNLKGFSARYAAPEVLIRFIPAAYQGPQVISSGDIYGFGVICYELLLRKVPWKDVQYVFTHTDES